MAVPDIRYFSHPGDLKGASPKNLARLLLPYTDFLESKGLSVSISGVEVSSLDYAALANILMTSSPDTPRELIDSLQYMHEMATPEAMDYLLREAGIHGIPIDDSNLSPADLAVQVWLHDRSILEHVYAEQFLIRPCAFVYFQEVDRCGAGSLCGRAMGAKRSSTIGYERHYNGALQTASKEEFISALTENMPPAPDHFSRCSAVNRDAPALTSSLPAAVPLEPSDFYARLQAGNVLVLDVRSYDSYGGLHVPGSYHIDIGGNFATFAGWILPPDNDILLVTESLEQGYDATTWLRRVGLDRVIGQIDGGIFAYAKAGMPVRHTAQVPVHEISKHMGVDQGYQLLDVRSPTEFGSVHIEGAINIPVHELRTRYTELDSSLPTMVMCASGHRSSLATSLLEQRGFAQIMNVAGGMTGYSAAGFAPTCPMCVAPHGPQTVQN